MKIAIISAMDEEIAFTKEKFQAKEINKLNNQVLSTYVTKKNEYYLLNSGIGKVNAAITTTLLIEQYKPDLIISIGTAGGVNKALEIGDLVVGDKLVFHDVDVTGFDYKLGQLPGEKIYLTPNNLEEFTKKLDDINLKYHVGTIATGDIFVNKKEKTAFIEENFDNIYAIEMESTAILMTANHLDTKCYVVRTISDLAHSDSSLEFNEYLDIVSQKFFKLVNAFENE